MKIIKNTVGVILLLLITTSCSKENNSKVLFEKKFSTNHPDGRGSEDTLVKKIDIKFEDTKEPLKIFWITSKDSEGCFRVSYARLERVNIDSKMQVDSITTKSLDCAMKFDSPDSTLFNQILFSGDFSTMHNIRTNIRKGHFLTIMGNGELTGAK